MLTRYGLELPINVSGLLRDPPQQYDFPARITQLEQQASLMAEEHYRLMRALQGAWDLLNSDGALTITQAVGAFNSLMTRNAPPGLNVIYADHCCYVVPYYEIEAGGGLEIQAGATLEIG